MSEQATPKQVVLNIGVAVGNLLRSDKVTFNVNGPELQQVNQLVDNLQTVLNQIQSDAILVEAPVVDDLPDLDIEVDLADDNA